MPSNASANRIGGLEALIRAQAAKGPAPEIGRAHV